MQRNVSHNAILKDESRSLKDKRWTGNGSVDEAAEEYMNQK